MDEICGKFKYHLPMAENEFVCDCEESEGYGLSTQFDDACECFEEREE